MKRVTPLCTLLLAVVVPTASAAPGLNLRWSACLGDGGVINRAFACNTNSGSHVLVGGFELGEELYVKSLEDVIDVVSASPTLPAWWSFRNAGACRMASLTMSFVISPTAVSCIDWSSGQAAGGLTAYELGALGPSTARIRAAHGSPLASFEALLVGVEYYSFNLVVNNANTVGAGVCAGCPTPVCLVFTSCRLTGELPTDVHTISGPTNGVDSYFATWQGSLGLTGCFITPTRRATWGAVKSLYR